MMDIAVIILVSVNLIFLLVGLSATVIGFVLRFGRSLYQSYLDAGLEKLETVLKDTNLDSFDVRSIDINEVLTSLSIAFIVGGTFVCGFSFLGCCGAFLKSKTMLKEYAITIVVIIVIEAFVIGTLYGNADIVKHGLKDQLTDFAGLGSSEVFSVGWNIIMIQFKCCGVDSYADFDRSASSKWKKITVGGIPYSLDTPIACCKTLPTTNVLDNCAVNPFDKSLNNYDKSCYDTVWDYTLGNTTIAIPVLGLCAIIQVLLIVCALSVATSQDKRTKVTPLG